MYRLFISKYAFFNNHFTKVLLSANVLNISQDVFWISQTHQTNIPKLLSNQSFNP